MRAALGEDGTKVEVIGERKIDGCSCQPSTVKEIALPYRPRAEDIDVALDKHGILSMRLLRASKPESATPLKVTVTEDHQPDNPDHHAHCIDGNLHNEPQTDYDLYFHDLSSKE